MKKIYYFYLLSLLIFSACNKDVLDKQPLDIISDATVWSDPELINGYLTQLYAQTAIFTQESPGYANGYDGDWKKVNN